MKTFITGLISCSLLLSAVAMAQQDEEQQKEKKKKSQQTSQAQAQPQATAGAQGGTKRGKGAARHEEHAPTMANSPAATESANVNATQERGKHKGKGAAHEEATNSAGTENSNVNATTQEGGKHKGKAAHAETTPATTENANVNATEGAGKKGKGATHNEAAMKTGSPGPAAAAGTSAGSGTAKIKSGTVGKNGKTVDVQRIKASHTTFRAQAQPQKIKTVTFNQNYRIVNAERWQGPQYEVFRVYRPAWHDSGWYRSNFSRVELIGGGYYYFNNGYWYPAWGYDPAAQYYAYDGPIYVGQRAEPPDQVIADVQAELQEQGYYTGEVDGLLGPLTREALTAYQSDHGLYATAVIDEPTLDALGMS
jgi:Putative peptidoglycan binding domain